MPFIEQNINGNEQSNVFDDIQIVTHHTYLESYNTVGIGGDCTNKSSNDSRDGGNIE
ncbi:hypothetical protein OIY81_3348 [Cryptosporidium canis]|nr:hypothetical protein OIY81_3348 [Cryptosporidium canis]